MLDRILQHGGQHEHSATTRLNPGSDHDNYGASLIRNQRDNHCTKDGEWFKPTSDPCYPHSVCHLHGTHINGVANGASTLLPEGPQLQVKIFQSCREKLPRVAIGRRMAFRIWAARTGGDKVGAFAGSQREWRQAWVTRCLLMQRLASLRQKLHNAWGVGWRH